MKTRKHYLLHAAAATLPVIAAMVFPRRLHYLFSLALVIAIGLGTQVSARVIVVDSTIQAAVDIAQPGDTVRIPSGTYRENVLVTKDNITIEGSLGAVLDGSGLAGNSGIRVAPVAPVTTIFGFTLSGLTIQNYSRNGVLLSRVNTFQISHGRYVDNEAYGIFPIRSANGLIDFNHVSGSDDTGIYVGSSSDIIIEKNIVRDCTVGIEVENSSRIAVEGNKATDNSAGILVQISPGRAVKVTEDISITSNVLHRNNRPNPVTDPSLLLSRLPSGIGVLNIAGDRVVTSRNQTNHNNSAGIAVISLPAALAALDPLIDPYPDSNKLLDNIVLHSGNAPDPKIAPLPGGDLLWDFSGTNNCWASNNFKTSFPAFLPACQ